VPAALSQTDALPGAHAGKEHGARCIDTQLRATGALGPAAGVSVSEDATSSDEDAAAAFCVSDDDDGEEDAGAGGGGGGRDDDGVVACVCGATTADEDGLFLQCANNLCRVWAHTACCGYASREEAEAALFFCARCRPAADALLADVGGGAQQLPGGGFAPLAAAPGAELTPSEAATKAWRSVHGARDVGAALASALGGDRAEQLRALLLHSRPGALRIALTHNEGAPLLCRAAEAGAVQCVRMLLSTPALPVSAACMGTPVAAFCAALEAAQPAVARAMLQGVPGLLALASRGDAAEDGGTALHAAAAGGDVECLRLALPPGAAARAAATATDSEGTTPFMFAAAKSVHAVRFLLEVVAGAAAAVGKELARVDNQGQNVCHYAASAGQADALSVLADAWPSLVHGRDKHGSTPLHLAAAEGRGAAIRALLRRQANVTSKDNAGWVPLMYADVAADAEGTLALLEHQPEAQLACMSGLMGDSRSEARVLKILRALAEAPAFFAVLNAFLRTRIHLLSSNLAFLLRRPAVLDVANKQRWFKAQLAAFLRSQPQLSLLAEEEAMEDEDGDDGAGRGDESVLWVSRATAFDDWVAWAARRGPAALRRPMWHKLRLLDAPASMGSGVERDTLELMASCMSASGLFAPTAEGGRALAPSPGALTPSRRLAFTAAGWLLGYCLLHERTLPLPLEAPFLRALLGRRATSFADLEAVDPVYHRSLSMILDAPGAEELGLFFAVEEGGETIELMERGSRTPVTDANKAAFAAAVAEWKLQRRTADAVA
jgi:hypothetical protein